ncbi:MAG: InlB B-repeat-containing protein, partial [Dehalobacterium sp.]
KLNKESVLFTTAAGSSTPTVTDTLKAYSPPNAGSLQLTIKDSSRSLTVDSVTAQSLAKGSTVTVAYSNASVSDSSHLVVLLDNGVRKYYGVIKELTAGNESGTADFTLPAGMTTGDYTLKLWNEQFAGTNCTNYASEPVTGSITAPTYTVTYHANGGTGTAIVSNKAAGETFSAASPDGLTAPSGQQFKEWNTDSSGTGTGYRAETAVTMPAENLTLYAIWENINDNGGLNYNPGNRAITPNMIEFGGDLYVTWAEYADGHTQIRVKRFNGTTWSSADRGSLGQDAYNPVLCEFNGSLYLAWYEAPGSDKIYQVYIRKYEGGADWSSDVNLSYSNNKAFNVKLKVYDGMLYAVWVENNGTRNQIRAKKTSDGSTWSTADDLNNTVNYNSANHVTIPGIEVYDDALYAAWSEKGNIRAKKYDGTSWSTADSNTGLNYDGTKTAHVPVLLDGTSTLYLLWLEENEAGIYQVRAKKFNGTTWVEADNGSLNYDQSKGASMLTGFVHNGTIYAAWTEDGRVRIKSSQATGHTWTLADNGNVNYDAAKASSGLTFVEYQGQLYLSWKEDNGTTDQIRLKVH